jgi:UDP-3-O-[3-hydroxymyristoyl] glucosamine N-acyltransferase
LLDDLHISGATAVTRSIPKAGVHANPVVPMPNAEWAKNLGRMRHPDDMVGRLRHLEEEFAALKAQDRSVD